MLMTQSDIAGLSDAEARLIVAGLRALPSPQKWFNIRVADALQDALDERRRILTDLDVDVEDDGAEGQLVGPDDDPVAEACRQLREGPLP